MNLGLASLKVKLRNVVAGLDNSALTHDEAKHWADFGFLKLPGFFSGAEIDQLIHYVDGLWESARATGRKTVVDVFIGSPNERRIYMKDAPTDAAKKPHKVNDLFLEEEAIRNMVLNSELSAKLRVLLKGDPLVCNTLNFLYGSQQPFHTDSLYMTPPKALNLVATWIALEDVHPDAGPLQYYPRSHKIPPFYFSHGRMRAIDSEMKSYDEYMKAHVERMVLKPEVFCPRKGDVFIWHSQLYHRGSAIKNGGLTRKSLVTHYFRNGDMDCRSADIGGHRFWQVREPQPVMS